MEKVRSSPNLDLDLILLSLAAALLDGLFEQPARFPVTLGEEQDYVHGPNVGRASS